MNIPTIPNKPARRRGQQGFTLVELLLVLTILAILAGIVLPKLSGKREQANISAAKAQISIFSTALDNFEVDVGYYPKGAKGLQDLLTQPRSAQGWHGPYLQNVQTIPPDPWGQAYVYECPGRHNPSGYDISCKSQDGTVIGNWNLR